MPLTVSGAYVRSWRFVDQFEAGDDITREALDQTVDDLAVAMNAALSSVAEARSYAEEAEAFAAAAASAGATAGAEAGAEAALAAAATKVAEAAGYAGDAEAARDEAEGFAADINPARLMIRPLAAFTGDLNTPPSDVGKTILLEIGTGTTNGPAGLGVGDFVLHFETSSTEAIQLALNGGGTSILFHRAKIAGTWSAWAQGLTTSGDFVITGGRTTANINDGQFASGNYQLTPNGGNMRRIENAGAFNILAPNVASDCEMKVLLTNVTGAGAVTFVGFTATGGSPILTTPGLRYLLEITKLSTAVFCRVQSLQ